MRIPFRDLAKRLTGISTPVFGLSWQPSASEQHIVRGLMLFLEDRRVLYHPYQLEVRDWVVQSVLQIREELTRVLQGLEEDSGLIAPCQAMRAACRKFLDATHSPRHRSFSHHLDEDLFTALGELRAIVGLYVAQLCLKYGLDVEGELASILPASPENADSEDPTPRP